MLRVHRNGLVEIFPNNFDLFHFCIILSARTILIRLKLVWTCLDMLELENIPGRDFKPSIRTLFGKTSHFNCPLKLCNNFISFREPIYLSKQKKCFL